MTWKRLWLCQNALPEGSDYIIKYFDQRTKRNSFYALKGQRVVSFNSILLVSSIPMAQIYYREVQNLLAVLRREMTSAIIFSYNPNEVDLEDAMADESFDTDSLDATSRNFLECIIADYNRTFSTNYDTSYDKFQNYCPFHK